MKLSKTLSILFLIFIVALFLRLYDLGDMPSGFHRDEVISGYVGRFILETGKDIYGNSWPIFYVDKYGDYPPVIPMYLSGLSTYLFDVTVFATRFPVAVIGALIVFPMYFLTLFLFKNKTAALFSAGMIALLPWHIVLSRATAEGIIALTVFTTGFFLLLKSIKEQHTRLLIVSSVILLSTYLLYPSFRVLLPLILLPLPFLYHKIIKRSYIRLLLLGLVMLSFLFTLLISSTDWGSGRFNQTSMFGSQSGSMIKSRIEILANEEGPNRVTEVKIFHNKYVIYTREIITQYLTYFSPQYLFLHGGLPYRYTVSDQGLLYLSILPFLLLGLLYFKELKQPILLYLAYLLLISPLPAPITLDDVPNVHRTIFMILPLTLLASYGFAVAFKLPLENKWKFPLSSMLAVILLIEVIYFLHMYVNHANAVKSFERGDTNKEVMTAIIQRKDNAESVYMPVHDAFPIYYLFFTKNFDLTVSEQFEQNLRLKQVNQITFTEEKCPSSLPITQNKKKVLVLDEDGCKKNPLFEVITAFSRHDGTTSYTLLHK